MPWLSCVIGDTRESVTPAAATGGFAGAAVAAAIRFGVARGVFSGLLLLAPMVFQVTREYFEKEP